MPRAETHVSDFNGLVGQQDETMMGSSIVAPSQAENHKPILTPVVTKSLDKSGQIQPSKK